MTNSQKYSVLVHQSPINGEVTVLPANDEQSQNTAAESIIKAMYRAGEILAATPKPGESASALEKRRKTYNNVRCINVDVEPRAVVSVRHEDETDEAWTARCALARRSGLIILDNAILRELSTMEVLKNLPQWGKSVTMQTVDVQDLG